MVAAAQRHAADFFLDHFIGEGAGLDGAAGADLPLMQAARFFIHHQTGFVGGIEHPVFADMPMQVGAVVADRLDGGDIALDLFRGRKHAGMGIEPEIDGAAVAEPFSVEIEAAFAIGIGLDLEDPEAKAGADLIAAGAGLHGEPAGIEIGVADIPELGFRHGKDGGSGIAAAGRDLRFPRFGVQGLAASHRQDLGRELGGQWRIGRIGDGGDDLKPFAARRLLVHDKEGFDMDGIGGDQVDRIQAGKIAAGRQPVLAPPGLGTIIETARTAGIGDADGDLVGLTRLDERREVKTAGRFHAQIVTGQFPVDKDLEPQPRPGNVEPDILSLPIGRNRDGFDKPAHPMVAPPGIPLGKQLLDAGRRGAGGPLGGGHIPAAGGRIDRQLGQLELARRVKRVVRPLGLLVQPDLPAGAIQR